MDGLVHSLSWCLRWEDYYQPARTRSSRVSKIGHLHDSLPISYFKSIGYLKSPISDGFKTPPNFRWNFSPLNPIQSPFNHHEITIQSPLNPIQPPLNHHSTTIQPPFLQVPPGFYDPNSGDVLVNGLPLRHLPVRSWRRMLGYVGQHPVLFATSALENIKACWTRGIHFKSMEKFSYSMEKP